MSPPLRRTPTRSCTPTRSLTPIRSLTLILSRAPILSLAVTLSPSLTLGAERSLPNHMHDLTFWNFNQSDKETQWLNWDWCAHRSAPHASAAPHP